MSEPYEIKRFPLAAEFSRMLGLVEDCEAELLNAEMSVVSSEWRPNMKIEAVFDDDEAVVIEIKIKPRRKEE